MRYRAELLYSSLLLKSVIYRESDGATYQIFLGNIHFFMTVETEYVMSGCRRTNIDN